MEVWTSVNKIKLDWISLAALFACGGVIWGGVWLFRATNAVDAEKKRETGRRESTIARFRPFLRQYSMNAYSDEFLSQPPYVKSKAVAVGLGEYQVDWRHDIAFGGARLETFDFSIQQLQHPEPFIDGLHFELPADIRAATPAEVQTRFLVEWHRDVVGRYKFRYSSPKDTAGLPEAYRYKCTLTIIDDTRQAMVGRMEFVGDMPPMESGQGRVGRLPLEQIVKAVANLPRR
jgi:hypothetical protein